MAIKVLLYRYGEYGLFNKNKEEKYIVVEDAIRSFDSELFCEEFPFRDEDSKKFLQKTYNIHYVDEENDRYAVVEGNRIYGIQEFSDYMKQGLALIKNSKSGYFTHITKIDRTIANVLRHWDSDLLIAFNADYDSFDFELFWYSEFEIVNFNFNGKETTLNIANKDYRGEKIVHENEYYKIYQIGKKLYADGYYFFEQFQYDWRKSLPTLEWYIGCKYREPVVLGEFCQWYDAGVFADKKVFSHIKFIKNCKFFSRRLAVLFIEYLKDDTVRMSKINTVKYPTVQEILEDLELQPDSQKTFFMVIDVNETIRDSEELVDNCELGGWIYKEHLELFDGDEVLFLFKTMIPEILHKKLQFCGQ